MKKKKEPEFPGLAEPRIPGEPMHEPGIEAPPARFEPERPMRMPPMEMAPARPTGEPQIISKDLELISAKLDGMKATLDAINQRLTNLERIAAGEKRERYF